MTVTEAAIDVAQNVSTTPAYVWVATAIGILGLASGFIRREATGIGEWLAKRRRAADDQGQAERVSLEETVRRMGERQDQADRDLATERTERRAESAQTRSIIQAMTEHVWDWRRAHSANGHPYSPPASPRVPPGITEYLPVWPPDSRSHPD